MLNIGQRSTERGEFAAGNNKPPNALSASAVPFNAALPFNPYKPFCPLPNPKPVPPKAQANEFF